MCLRKTSGERAGPKDTLLRDAGFKGLTDESHLKVALAAVVMKGPVEIWWVGGEEGGLARDSSSSWIDMREVDMEEDARDRDDRPRGIVGVAVRLAFFDELDDASCTQ